MRPYQGFASPARSLCVYFSFTFSNAPPPFLVLFLFVLCFLVDLADVILY